MAVAGINFSPASGSAPGHRATAAQRGATALAFRNIDDSDMRRVLTYVVENGDRFEAGVRIDCLDALKAGVANQQIRRALMAAARKDQNPAVRMKALESLRDAGRR